MEKAVRVEQPKVQVRLFSLLSGEHGKLDGLLAS
jgi:hypothetical protein